MEGLGPVLLAPKTGLTDPDSFDYDGGRLVVSLIAGTSNDLLSIASQGDGPGQIRVQGIRVLYEGRYIGDVFGGSLQIFPLTVTFRGVDATPAAVQGVLRALQYDNVSLNPSPTPRTIRIHLDDGDPFDELGTTASENPIQVEVTVSGVNNPASLALPGPAATYTEDAPPVAVDDAATVTDPDSTDFDGGSLRIDITANGTVDDRLALENQGTGAGQIGVAGSTVTYEGRTIGAVAGGTGAASPMVVTFTGTDATLAAIQAVARVVVFEVASDTPSTAPRTIQFTIDDGDGGAPLQASISMGVAATNDPPVVTLPGGAATFVEDASPVNLDSTATATDVDSPDLIGGTLTVDFTANGTAPDRLTIENQGTGTGQISVGAGTVAFQGASLGTFSGGGSGSTPLVVSLSGAAATIAAVQTLVRAIQFSNVSDTPSTLTKTIRFVLTDGDGGTSLPATQSATVTPTNDGPTVTNVRITSTTHANDLSFAYDISDPEGDASSITVEYRGGSAAATFQTATVAGTTTGITPGTGRTITWNSASDEDGVAATDYELRITPSDGTAGTPGTTGPLRVDNSVFLPETSVTTLPNPEDLALADLDRDGVEDLILVTSSGNAVQVRLGNGNGTFAAASSFATLASPGSLAVGDLDRDGVLDVVVGAVGGLDVLLGNGDGTLQAAVTYAAGTQVRDVLVADLDKDAILDVAVAPASATVGILLGVGDGTLGGLSTTVISAASDSLVAGDLDRDGDVDLIAAPTGLTIVSVLLGNGAGGLAAEATYPVPNTTLLGRLALGDLNHDGALDVLLSGLLGAELTVLLGNGNGTLAAATTKGSVGGAGDVVVLDLDGDGAQDAVTSSIASNRIDVFFGNGDGTLQDRLGFAATNTPGPLAHGDPNRDGIPDVLAISQLPGAVSLHEGKTKGNGDGTFVASVALNVFGLGGQEWVQTADFNKDGNPDILVGQRNGELARVVLGNGTRSFPNAVVVGYTNAEDLFSPVVADFDSDGNLDLAYGEDGPSQTNIWVFSGDGDGTFSAPATYALTSGKELRELAGGDIDRDGYPDLVFINTAADSYGVMLNQGDGSFGTAAEYPLYDPSANDITPHEVALSDLDRDGILDLVLYIVSFGSSEPGLWVYLGQGDGTFGSSAADTFGSTAVDSHTFSLALRDINRDGRQDALMTYGTGVGISLGLGTGGFSPQSTYAVPGALAGLTLPDLDRDGIPDLATGPGTFSGVGVALGNGDGTFGTLGQTPLSQGALGLDHADFDHDGALDVVGVSGSTGYVVFGNP